jgi:hypothetical protein
LDLRKLPGGIAGVDGHFDPGRIALRGKGDVDVEFLGVVRRLRRVDQTGLVSLRVGGFVFWFQENFMAAEVVTKLCKEARLREIPVIEPVAG